MNISEKVKNIIIVILIFIAAILSVHYGLNINGALTKASDVLNEEIISKRKEVKLDSCIDGDTAQLIIDNKKIKVRFLAVDTPEVKHPNKVEEPYGKTASNFTCKLLSKAKKIEIAYEIGLTNKDKYNRDLVWIWADDQLVQEQLITNSLARVKYIYAKYKYTNNLLKLQKKVQQNRIGIWHDYIDKKDENEYIIVYKINNTSKTETIKNSVFPHIINNPEKKGYTFTGWTHNNKLYDLSQTITSNIILEPKYVKKSQ